MLCAEISNLGQGRWSLEPGYRVRWLEHRLEFSFHLPYQLWTVAQHIISTVRVAALSRKLHGSDSHQELAYICKNRGLILILSTNLSFSLPKCSSIPPLGLSIAHSPLPTHIPLARTQSCDSTKLWRNLGHVVFLGDQEGKETKSLDHIALSLPQSTHHLFTICSSISYYVPPIESIDLIPSETTQDHSVNATSSKARILVMFCSPLYQARCGSLWFSELWTRRQVIYPHHSLHIAGVETGYLKLKLPFKKGKNRRSNPFP